AVRQQAPGDQHGAGRTPGGRRIREADQTGGEQRRGAHRQLILTAGRRGERTDQAFTGAGVEPVGQVDEPAQQVGAFQGEAAPQAPHSGAGGFGDPVARGGGDRPAGGQPQRPSGGVRQGEGGGEPTADL